MSIKIPHFDEKFQYLFSSHPTIRNYAQLAAALRGSAPLVTGWKNGTEFSHPAQIPIKHIGAGCYHRFVVQ